MSQSTRLYTRMVFFDKNYNNKFEVEEDLEKARDRLARLRQRLMYFALMTEPKKFAPENETPEFYVENNVQVLMDEIQDEAIGIWKLGILLDRWDECHTSEGLGKYPPEEAQHTYIDGSFVFTDMYPTKEALLA